VLVIIGILCLCLAAFTIWDFIKRQALRWLAKILVARGAVIGTFFLMELVFTYYTVHLHHFFNGLLIATVVVAPTISHSSTAGLGLGLFVEGVGRWGWKPNLDVHILGVARDRMKTPRFNATSSGTSVTLRWEEEFNPSSWTRVYINDLLWVEGATRHNKKTTHIRNTFN